MTTKNKNRMFLICGALVLGWFTTTRSYSVEIRKFGKKTKFEDAIVSQDFIVNQIKTQESASGENKPDALKLADNLEDLKNESSKLDPNKIVSLGQLSGLSDKVLEVIARESEKNTVVTNPSKKKIRGKRKSDFDAIAEIEQKSNRTDRSTGSEEKISFDQKSQISVIEESGKKESSAVAEFTLIPEYDQNEKYSSRDGVVSFAIRSNKKNVMRAKIISKNKIDTIFELEIGRNSQIPLLDEIKFQEIASNYNNNTYLLIKMSDEFDDVSFEDEAHRDVIYLDKNLMPVKDKPEYVLFVGQNPGAKILTYLKEGKKVSERSIYITNNEVIYIADILDDLSNEEVEIKEENLMGTVGPTEYIEEDKIADYFNGTKSSRVSVNTYEIKRGLKPSGQRTYTRIENNGEVMYVGTSGIKNIKIPSSDLKSMITKKINLEYPQESCLNQVNLKNNVERIVVGLSNDYNSNNFEKYFINKYGQLSLEEEINAQKLILKSDEEGMFNIYIKYQDDSEEVITSQCVKNTYFVEQL